MEPHFFGFKKFVFAVSNSKIIIDNEIDFINNDFNPSEASKSNCFDSKESWMERRKPKERSHGEISNEKSNFRFSIKLVGLLNRQMVRLARKTNR